MDDTGAPVCPSRAISIHAEGTLPPIEYDHPYEGTLTIKEAPLADLYERGRANFTRGQKIWNLTSVLDQLGHERRSHLRPRAHLPPLQEGPRQEEGTRLPHVGAYP